MRTPWTSLVVMAAVVACAGGSQSGGGAGAPGAMPRRSGNVITAQEVAASSGTNALELVRQLRPQWLVVRGVAGARDTGAGGIQVYVDGVRRGSLETLDAIGAEQVAEIRFLDSSDATTRYGTGHVHGAIEVRTKR